MARNRKDSWYEGVPFPHAEYPSGPNWLWYFLVPVIVLIGICLYGIIRYGQG